METQQETATLDLGRIGYEAYREYTGGISLATGQKLPIFDELNDQVRGAWIAAGSAIGMTVVEELKRTAAATGGKATVKLAGEFSAVLEAEDPEPEHPTPEQVITPVQKPSIGRIVIYHHPDIGDVPAIVTKVLGGVLDALHLFVMTPTDGGYSRRSPVYYGHKPEHWSWPERV